MHRKYLLLILGSTLIVGIGLLFLRNVISQNLILGVPITSTTTGSLNLTPIGAPLQGQGEKSIGTTTQSGIIDEHLTIDNTVRSVDFCGTPHLVKRISINGVDVIARVAYFAENKLLSINGDRTVANDFCKSFAHISPSEQIPNPKMTGDLVQVEMKIPDVVSWKDQKNGHTMYDIYLPSWFFSIDSTSSDIYLIGGFDGSLIGPIGSLK